MSAMARPDVEFLEHRAELLDPALVPVFDERFVGSAILYDEFVYRLALGVFRETGLAAHLREPSTTAEVAARAGFLPERASVPLDWILRQLAVRGALTMTAPPDSPARYQLHGELPA